ncbi:hypothetical protein [Nostoc sp.]|uniref:hypothetical protein n=1 Tax=Nostoc sp. TaxID=1180 RepID=UPI002FFA1091
MKVLARRSLKRSERLSETEPTSKTKGEWHASHSHIVGFLKDAPRAEVYGRKP